MGAALTDAVWIFAAVIALIVVSAAALASRRYLLERSGGTVECALRLVAQANWRLGVLAYKRDDLCWYGALGVLLRPEHVFARRALSVLSRRPADLAESAALGADRIVVEISTGAPAASVQLAMTEEALTGFLAWLEASPPGSHLSDIALKILTRNGPVPPPPPPQPHSRQPRSRRPHPARANPARANPARARNITI